MALASIRIQFFVTTIAEFIFGQREILQLYELPNLYSENSLHFVTNTHTHTNTENLQVLVLIQQLESGLYSQIFNGLRKLSKFQVAKKGICKTLGN